MIQENDFLELNAYAAHIRSGLDGGSSILFEIGRVDKNPKLFANKKMEYYANLQNHLKASRGVYILNSIEYYKNKNDNSYRVKFGPAIQYFPMNRVELRIDLNNTRNFNQQVSVKDRWDLMGQVHLWL